MELAELVTYLDHKFAKINERFEVVDQRFNTIDQHFESIDQRFKITDQKFEALNTRFDGLDNIFVTKDEFAMGLFDIEQRLESKFNARFDLLSRQISNMYSYLDTHAKKMDTYFQEFTILNNQVNRHERWHHETAGVLGLALKS